MPYKSEKIKIQGTMLDRRRKLTDEQKVEIEEKYKTGLTSQRLLAKEYNVSRSVIQVIVNKDIAERKKEYVKNNWKKYSNRKDLTKATRETRQYKQRLLLSGKISLPDEKQSLNNADGTEDTFTCEICKCVTPKRCEGSEPNTCADCMPLFD